jgi:hypothetical protein
MGRFVIGFGSSLVACAGVYWFALRPQGRDEPCQGMCGRGTVCEGSRCVGAPGDAAGADDDPEAAAHGRRRRGGTRAGALRGAGDEGRPSFDDSRISDDMDLGAQQIDMEHGGEQQLTNATIESVMDKNFGNIRRCVLLAQSDRDEPVHGRMAIGIRIRPSGEVAAVTVTPPAPLTGGEIVPCVRTAVARIRFPSFDGREMAVTYPVNLD